MLAASTTAPPRRRFGPSPPRDPRAHQPKLISVICIGERRRVTQLQSSQKNTSSAPPRPTSSPCTSLPGTHQQPSSALCTTGPGWLHHSGSLSTLSNVGVHDLVLTMERAPRTRQRRNTISKRTRRGSSPPQLRRAATQRLFARGERDTAVRGPPLRQARRPEEEDVCMPLRHTRRPSCRT